MKKKTRKKVNLYLQLLKLSWLCSPYTKEEQAAIDSKREANLTASQLADLSWYFSPIK